MKAFLDKSQTKWIEIKEEDGGIYLYQYNEKKICISDTWHLSIKEAKEQAAFEFGIKEDEWIE